MVKDPFYQQILEGLSGDLNPQDFEDCMADVLRDEFPTLVPVRGGKDSGMDGAIADGEGEPFPLVVTTAKDVARNLRKSLDSFMERGQPARKAVFATSRSLTPQRRLKLMDLARKKGFTLVQIIEQRGVADRLYRNSRWCRQLLGLSGQPSALSVVPRTHRPLLDLEPIGRTEDIDWLKQTSGDRVLSGDPGSGKTFLLYSLARKGWGLFVVGPQEEIENAIRDERPSIVIVDDAHTQPEILVDLRRLRTEIGIDFSIVATTWEGGRDSVVEALGVRTKEGVRRLELLTRAEILKIFENLGVRESAGIMRYLVDQAANKPGLAATIGTLWLQGEWQDVIDGKALSRTLLDFFQKHVGSESTDVLAAFSLGGDRGVGMETVREFLGLNRVQIRQIATGLAAGGVLSEVDRDTLAVWPQPFRYALIRTVFFSGPGYPYQDLIRSVPSLKKAVETLIMAKSLGASVPAEELRHLVLESDSLEAWNGLARLSEEDARWVLAHYPGAIEDVGKSLLEQCPEAAAARLLERAADSTLRPIHSYSDHPMRVLSDWIRDLDVPLDQMIARRRMLATTSKRYLEEGGETSVGVHGIALALSPTLESSSLDPGLATR